jgi:excisionase family DNA binding protein
MAGQAESRSAVVDDDDRIKNHNRAVYADQLARLNGVETVMGRLGLGRSKTFGIIASGELRSVKIGRRRLVSEAALVEYIERLDAGGGV